MKRILFIIIILSSVVASAQRISHNFNNVTMPEALRQLNRMQNRYTINFIFNDLEDFRITTSVKGKSVPDAIRQIIGFYPIEATIVSDSIINVECSQKTALRYKGRVVDASGQPIEFANVALLSPKDSTLLAGGVSNQSGFFTIPYDAQEVVVRVTSVGYRPVYKRTTNTMLGTLRLYPQLMMIKGVVVKGKILRKSATAETYTITDSLRKGCVNALQLFGKLQGITVNPATDEVKIGKDTNVPLMLDGRDVGMEYIRTITPERIRMVEILRYPKGKYGNAPIVMNIITRDDYAGFEVGSNAAASYSPRYGNSNTEKVGSNFTISTDKWSTYMSVDFTHRNVKNAKAYEYSLNDTAKVATTHENVHHPNLSDISNTANLSLGADWHISKAHVLSLQTWLKASHDNNQEDYTFVGRNYNSALKDHYDAITSTTGLFYNGQFQKNTQLSSQLTFTAYKVDETRFFNEKLTSSRVGTEGNRKQWNYNAEVLKKWLRASLLAGTNISYRRYVNKDETTKSPLYTSRENRYETYTQLIYNPFDKFSLAVGGSLLNIRSRNDEVKKSETSFQPNLKLYYEILPWLQLSGNYFCDVTYPNLDQLSPVSYSVNNFLFHIGCPDLKARIMHYMEFYLNIEHVGKLNFMLKRSHNEITPWYYVADGKAWETLTNGNYRHQYFGFEGDYNLPHNFELNIVANYQWYKLFNDETKGRHGRTWYLDTELYWTGIKGLTLYVEYFLRHDKRPLLQGREYDQEEVMMLSATKRIFKGRLQVSLIGFIPVETISKRTYRAISIPGYAQTYWNNDKINTCRVMLNMRFNIGNHKSHKRNNSVKDTQEKEY